jgi:hypothetical protein
VPGAPADTDDEQTARALPQAGETPRHLVNLLALDRAQQVGCGFELARGVLAGGHAA